MKKSERFKSIKEYGVIIMDKKIYFLIFALWGMIIGLLIYAFNFNPFVVLLGIGLALILILFERQIRRAL